MQNFDGVTQLANINLNLAKLSERFSDAFPLGASRGSFTCSAASTTVVANENAKSTSMVFISPTNADAATLMSSASALYLSSKEPGVSFTLVTADAGSADGTETFDYLLVNVG